MTHSSSNLEQIVQWQPLAVKRVFSSDCWSHLLICFYDLRFPVCLWTWWTQGGRVLRTLGTYPQTVLLPQAWRQQPLLLMDPTRSINIKALSVFLFGGCVYDTRHGKSYRSYTRCQHCFCICFIYGFNLVHKYMIFSSYAAHPIWFIWITSVLFPSTGTHK